MSTIPQSDIRPAVNIPWASAIEAIATAAIAKDDVVVLDGADDVLPKCSPADADASVPTQFFVATGKAVAGDKVFLVPWKVLTGVDTSGASSVGDPVYLSTTAGGWTTTQPTGADDLSIIVGYVLAVDASAGVVRLEPGSRPQGTFKIGTVTIVSGTTAPGADPDLGGAFTGARVIASFAEAPGNDASVFAAMSTTTLQIRTTTAVTSDTDVNYIAYSATV